MNEIDVESLAESLLALGEIEEPVEITTTETRLGDGFCVIFFEKLRMIVIGSISFPSTDGEFTQLKFFNIDTQECMKTSEEKYEGGIESLCKLDEDCFIVGSFYGILDLYSAKKMEKISHIDKVTKCNEILKLNEDVILVDSLSTTETNVDFFASERVVQKKRREDYKKGKSSMKTVSISQKRILHTIESAPYNRFTSPVLSISNLRNFYVLSLAVNKNVALIEFNNDFSNHKIMKEFKSIPRGIRKIAVYEDNTGKEVLVAGGEKGRLFFYDTTTYLPFRTLQLRNIIGSILTFGNRYLLAGLHHSEVVLFNDLHLDHIEPSETVEMVNREKVEFYDKRDYETESGAIIRKRRKKGKVIPPNELAAARFMFELEDRKSYKKEDMKDRFGKVYEIFGLQTCSYDSQRGEWVVSVLTNPNSQRDYKGEWKYPYLKVKILKLKNISFVGEGEGEKEEED